MEWNLVNGVLTISGEITHTTESYNDWPWYSQRANITSVKFSNVSFTVGSNAYGMFYYCDSLTSLNLSNFNTSNVINMRAMFYYCRSLTSLDLSNFDTSNVINMRQMFFYCDSLTSLNLSNFDTSNVTDMRQMFSNCTALISLNLSNFNTSKVTDMAYMFFNCNSLTSLNLSNFNTSNVTDMSGMFHVCRSLTSLNLSNFNTSKVTKMASMFDDCPTLTSLDLSNFNTSNVTDTNYMFYNCNSLTSLNLSNFDTSNVTDMNDMFQKCQSLISLDLSNFNTSKVTKMVQMFRDCGSLQNIYISSLWNIEQVTNSFYMFFNCNSLPNYVSSVVDKTRANADVGGYLTAIPGSPVCAYYDSNNASLNFIANLDSWRNGDIDGTRTYYVGFDNLSSLTEPGWPSTIETVNFVYSIAPKSTYKWFYNCTSLTTFNNLQLLDTSNVTSMGFMFDHCTALTSLDLSSFDTSNVTDMQDMFNYCTSLTLLNLSNFDTSKVTSMSQMFAHCTALTSLNLNNFNTSKVTSMSDMFGYCTALTLLDLSSFDTSNVTIMSEMFLGCSNLTLLDLSSFNTSKVTNMSYMFYRCTATIPVLYVYQTECTIADFVTIQGTIYLVRDPEVAENTAVRDFWRFVAGQYNNVHFEYDDATRPTITPEISRGKLVNNQWQVDESGNTIKIKLNPQTYNNNISLVLSTNNIKSSGGLSIEVIDCNNYTVSQDSLINDLFYITFNTDSDKQYDANVILTDLSGIPVTRSIILPGVFAMIEFRAGGHGMSIGKICEQDGLEIDIPTAIGKKLLLPTNNNTIDLAQNQLVVGKYNISSPGAFFVIGNGEDKIRSNALAVYEKATWLSNEKTYITKNERLYDFRDFSDIQLDDIITEVNNLDLNNFYLDNEKGLTSGAFSYHIDGGKSQTSLKIDLTVQTTIKFFAYVSSESSYDFGAIYIGPQSYSPTANQIKNGTISTNGGQYVYRKSGNQSLEEVSTTLKPGEYYISFIYAKDGSDNSNDDRFYVNAMIFETGIFTIDNENISLNSAGDLITPTMAGQIIMFGGATSKIPLGWLPCDGSSVLIADYPLLAAALYDGSAYVWGQEDSTHFNLPDLRGRAPIGVNGDATTTGLTARTVGTKNIGEETHVLKAAEAAQKAVSTNGMSANASHNHEMGYKVADRGSGSTDTRMGPYGHTTSGVTVINTASTSVAHTHSITGSDATTGHNNMQPSAVVNFIICTGQISQ